MHGIKHLIGVFHRHQQQSLHHCKLLLKVQVINSMQSRLFLSTTDLRLPNVSAEFFIIDIMNNW